MNFDAEVEEPPDLELLIAIESDDACAAADERLGRRHARARQADDEDAPAGELVRSSHGWTNWRKSR